MKNVVLMIATAGSLLVGGAALANAQGVLSSGFRGESDAWVSDRNFPADARGEYGRACEPVTVREQRGGEVIVRQINRC
jgi:hypothetical protein